MSLKQQILDLGPWHLKVQVTPELTTAVGPNGQTVESSVGPVSFLDTEQEFRALMQAVYPQGLGGKRFLDVACNCGAYSFWAKELGAAECFGFDARDHWIRQAEFLKQHRTEPSDGITFRSLDLYALPQLHLEPFHVGMFEGIFYHLPDPIGGLKLVADLTQELLIFNTATRAARRGGLVMATEQADFAMNGIHGLNWYPTSPRVLEGLLRWMGFVEFRLIYWRKRVRFNRQRGWKAWLKAQLLRTGRFHLLASRTPGLFADFDRSGYRI